MTTATVHRVSNEFDDRNLFLQVALGLVSACHQLPSRLDRYAPVTAGRPAEPDRHADAFLHFLLGLVSVSKTVTNHLARLEPSPRPPVGRAAPARGIVPRSLLR